MEWRQNYDYAVGRWDSVTDDLAMSLWTVWGHGALDYGDKFIARRKTPEEAKALAERLQAVLDAPQEPSEPKTFLDELYETHGRERIDAILYEIDFGAAPQEPSEGIDWRDLYDRAAKIANQYEEMARNSHDWMVDALAGANRDRDHLLKENLRLIAENNEFRGAAPQVEPCRYLDEHESLLEQIREGLNWNDVSHCPFCGASLGDANG